MKNFGKLLIINKMDLFYIFQLARMYGDYSTFEDIIKHKINKTPISAEVKGTVEVKLILNLSDETN